MESFELESEEFIQKKKYIALAVCCARKLFSNVNLLPPFENEDSDDEEIAYNIGISRSRQLRITGYVEKIIPGFSNQQFQMHFRLNRISFEKIVPVIHNIIKKEKVLGRPRIDTEKQLLCVLWLLATPDSFRSVGERFDMGKSSLSKTFFRVVTALNKIASKIIVWPSDHDMERIKELFYNCAGIGNIIGAIDGTFIPIKAPKYDAEVYITRKCNYAITLQAVCDPKLKFTDCFVGYPGSVSDTRIFRNCDLYRHVNTDQRRYFPRDEFIIGDKAYPVLSWCLSPYVDRGNLLARQKNFNMKISQTRQVIERAFALLFGRFRRLKFLDMNRTDCIPATILACCVLHNLCLNDIDSYVDEYITEGAAYVTGNDEEINVNDINALARQGHDKREIICQQLYQIEEL